MPNAVNSTVQVSHKTKPTNYYFSPKHRGSATNEISVWTIDFDREISCFNLCYQNGWHNDTNGWGFISSGIRQLLNLGHNLRSQDLIIAKFVVDQNQWHGYPADIRYKPSDKPLPQILISWFNSGHISKVLMLRIKQGQL